MTGAANGVGCLPHPRFKLGENETSLATQRGEKRAARQRRVQPQELPARKGYDDFGSRLKLSLLAGWTAVTAGASLLAAPVEITIRALPEQMRYDITEFRVFAGERVRLTFQNDDSMPHNTVVCRPRAPAQAAAGALGEDHGMEVARAAWTLGEQAAALNWVPPHPRVLAATKILESQTSAVIEFTVPAQPGRYPYVCTFPGHAGSMFGAMQVQARMEGLRNLGYRVFPGAFTAYPDFAAFKDGPVTRGTLPDGLIDAKVGGTLPRFAVEFEGTLVVPKDGDYTFAIAGDNGPVLLIDDRVVIDHRQGKTWDKSASHTIALARGERRLVLRYWHRREPKKPQPEVTLLWSGTGFVELPLCRVDLISRERQSHADQATGMPLEAENGEPAFYRNFIAGVMPSGFGVGYPGGVNLTWDPMRMNVDSLWAGAFLDIKLHRTQRGGMIQPKGFALVAPATGSPFALLPARGTEWPDSIDPESTGYRFLGYTFDAHRRPTFRYQFHDIAITDFFVASGNAAAGELRLKRRLALKSTRRPAPHLMFRVLRGSEIEVHGDRYIFAGTIAVVPAAGSFLRRAGAVQEVLLPIDLRNGFAEFEIDYIWSQHRH